MWTLRTRYWKNTKPAVVVTALTEDEKMIHVKTWTFILQRQRGWLHFKQDLFMSTSDCDWNHPKCLMCNEISSVSVKNLFLFQEFMLGSPGILSVVWETTAGSSYRYTAKLETQVSFKEMKVLVVVKLINTYCTTFAKHFAPFRLASKRWNDIKYWILIMINKKKKMWKQNIIANLLDVLFFLCFF